MLKIISGGQTGIDQLGLVIAKGLGLPTGGMAPLGYKTELGSNILLRDLYGLTESTKANYNARTVNNIVNSDGTVLFGNMLSPGTHLTITMCNLYTKPYIENPKVEDLVNFIIAKQIKVLNVAGNRGSKLSSLQIEEYGEILTNALKRFV